MRQRVELPLQVMASEYIWIGRSSSELENRLKLAEEHGSLLTQAEIQFRMGKYAKSRELAERARGEIDNLGLIDKVRVFHLLGHLAFQDGYFGTQQEMYRTSLNISTSPRYREGEGNSRILLGNSAVVMGLINSAPIYFRDGKREYEVAEKIGKETKNTGIEGRAILSEGILFDVEHQDKGSGFYVGSMSEIFNRCEPLLLKWEDSYGLSILRYYQAMVGMRVGDRTAARYLDEAQGFSSLVGNRIVDEAIATLRVIQKREG